MRKLSIVLSLLFVGLTQGLAQGQGQRQRMDPEKMVQQRADAWQESFGLSDEQHKKVKEILTENLKASRTKIQELRGTGDREAMRKAVEDLRADLDKKLKNVFNEQQWTAYEKWKEENPAIQRRRRGGGN